MPDEQSLIKALQQRDPDALAQVFNDYADKIYRLALGLLHDEQQADGVVQDTFLKLIEYVDRFEGRSEIGTWLYRVAYNESMSRLRRVKPAVDLDEMEKDDTMPTCLVNWQDVPEQTLRSNEAMAELERAVARLSPSLRSVFLLRDVEECSIRETAEILQISESAVKVRLHRARLALRESLATYFVEYVTS